MVFLSTAVHFELPLLENATNVVVNATNTFLKKMNSMTFACPLRTMGLTFR